MNRWLIELAPHFYEFRASRGRAEETPRLGTKRRLGPERPTPRDDTSANKNARRDINGADRKEAGSV